jgi:hypothetical protein
MLDFDKLAAGLRETLAKETTETIDKWFQEYENQSIQSYLGNGVYCDEPIERVCYCVNLEDVGVVITSENEPGNDYSDSYSMAA